ncbi:MAG: PEP-CTERM sorting domain-containing protein [Planctomycetota bacterium]|jgi:hypothetical protein
MKANTAIILTILFVILPVCHATNLVTNPGFETPETTNGGWPSTYGDWYGDYSSIVGTSSGVIPYGGSYMLQLKGTSWGSGASSANACQVPQIVDISSFASLIASGNAVVTASAYFNRVSGDAQTDTQVGISVFAYEGSPSSYPSDRAVSNWLLRENAFFDSDDDPGTWELCELQMTLPTNTDYIVIDIQARENIYNDISGTEFDGHFADNVTVEVVPEPATLLLFALGVPLLSKLNRRKR